MFIFMTIVGFLFFNFAVLGKRGRGTKNLKRRIGVGVGRYQIESSARIEASMIQNVIASDFNADGMLDILLQTSGANASSAVYLGNRDEFADPMTFDSPADSKLHFLLMDYNMDLKPDLFGQTENGTRAFWVNNGDGTFTLQPFTTTEALNPLASPHSNSFVDINGDCLPELVLFSANPTTNSTDMEIWLLDGSSVSLDRIIPLPQGAGQLSFADLGETRPLRGRTPVWRYSCDGDGDRS